MIKNRIGIPISCLLMIVTGLSNAGEKCPVFKQTVAFGAQAIELAKKIIPAYGLTSIADQCLDLKLDEKSAEPGYEIDVHEIHSKACGGDEMFSPRIMSINIMPNGYVSTTAYSSGTDISYKPLICKRKSRHRKIRL